MRANALLKLSILLSITMVIPSVMANTFDVSYLWHRQVTSVEVYKGKVGNVLGPAVAKDLRVVQKPGMYGLIYYRNGSSNGAVKAAKTHTRLLRASGLDGAVVVKSTRWNFTGSDQDSVVLSDKKTPVENVAKKLITTDTKTVSLAKAVNDANISSTNIEKKSKAASTIKPGVSDIERAVEKHVKKLRKSGAIAPDEKTAWSVYDFTTGEKLVDINEDVSFQAASLVKPFFALAFFHQSKQSNLNYGPQTKRHMQRMIQNSNNASTNWIMRRVGGPKKIQQILKKHYPKIFQHTRIVEYIPASGRTYRNKASVHDYSRFLYALWKNEISGAKEIRRLMALPGPDRIYTGADRVPAGTKVYNKTGSTAQLCGDMGILVIKDDQGKRFPYTLVGVIEKRNRARNYTRWIRSRGNVIRSVSNIVYDGISQYHKI